MGAEHDVVVVVVVGVAVKALDSTELRHSLPDMSTLTAIALSIQWWGLRAMYVRMMRALRSDAFARESLQRRSKRVGLALVAGTAALFSCWVGTALSAERHQ
jgi:hypothetical protein